MSAFLPSPGPSGRPLTGAVPLRRGLLMLAVVLASCGGGGGGAGSGDTFQLRLSSGAAFTPWASGQVDFTLTPALAAGETLSCRVNGGAAQDCSLSAAAGRALYQEQPVGPLRVEATRTLNGRSASAALDWRVAAPELVVYGGTPAGIVAALAAARQGLDVVVLEPRQRVGGMMAGGLAKSDVGPAPELAIGGLASEVFTRIRAAEQQRGRCTEERPCSSPYDFEPHVAAAVLRQMLDEQPRIWVQVQAPLRSVQVQARSLHSLTVGRGRLSAGVFIDASYEGDLMAAAGVSFTTQREHRRSLATGGTSPADVEDGAGFGERVRPYALNLDPYRVPGDPGSGYLPFVEAPTAHQQGDADDRVMAYNYRLCVTDDPHNRIPFERPANYRAEWYEASARLSQALSASGRLPAQELFFKPSPTVPSTTPGFSKYDLNGGAAFSTDLTAPGWNQAWAQADAAGRAAIESAYESYTRGLLYAWRTDPRFGALNAKVARYGLCKDEFEATGHWPDHLYVRESRRMLGAYVLNQNDLERNGRRDGLTDGIALGYYDIDSHIRRITTRTIGQREVIAVEGFQIRRGLASPPYAIPYRSLTPRADELDNLLNPVTVSATSQAYASLRMEPTYMAMGQAAGTAAAMAVRGRQAVQAISVAALQDRLRQDGQKID